MGTASAERTRPEVAWRPNPGPQTLLLTCPIEDVFYGGARGGGKSAGLLMDFAAHAQEYGEHAHGLLFRQSYPEFEELQKQAEEFYQPLGWTAHLADRAWESPNGARLRLRYLETAKDAAKHQGESNTWIGSDEAGNYADPKPIDLMVGTLRSKHGVRCYSRLTGNPGGVGHLWLKRRYIGPAVPGTPFTLETGRQGVFIPAQLEDNPYLIGTDYERNIKAATFGNIALWNAWRYGNWDVVAGAAFAEWMQSVHVVPTRDILPPSWQWFAGLDWGYAKGAAVLNCGTKERIEVVDSVEIEKTTAYEAAVLLATRWKPFLHDRKLEWLAYSPDMDVEIGVATTLTAEFREGWQSVTGRQPPMMAGVQRPGSRHQKFALMHQALWFTQADGVVVDPPFMVVQDRAKYLRESLPVLPLAEGDPNDIDTDADDHGYDAQGFVVAVRQPPPRRDTSTVPWHQDQSAVQWTTGHPAQPPQVKRTVPITTRLPRKGGRGIPIAQ